MNVEGKIEARAKYPRHWPGMPTRQSQMFESFVAFSPIWLAVVGIVLALLMPIVQSCRNAALHRAGQAPPLNGAEP